MRGPEFNPSGENVYVCVCVCVCVCEREINFKKCICTGHEQTSFLFPKQYSTIYIISGIMTYLEVL
jgi:hypothetical protein